MERYGNRGSVPVEGLQSDPVAGAETGLEESMWNLGLGGDGGGSGSVGGDLSYPERPDEADCIYFLRTGFCGYGPRCRFNHPRDRSTAIGALRPGRGEYPERVGQPLCQYFMRTGMCKFGASCKYNHPRKGDGSHVSVNYLGYPLRLGEQECNYYMKTGQCKFGASCKFHHPQPDGIQMPAASQASGAAANVPASYSTMQSPSGPSSQQYGMMAGNWQVARPTPFIPGSYIQGYGSVMLSPGMVPIAGWNPYPAPVNPVTVPNMQSAVGTGPFYGISQLSSSAPAYTRAYPLISSSMSPSNSTHKELAYPERPGQPECQFYLKTGDCKFGSSCRYHHPQEMVTPQTSIALSPMNLPLRPGAQPCSYYAQHGVCKFGPTCKYDHPMGGTLSYSPSASSLADMPVAPYPVGSSSLGTLAASYSSTDLLPTELTSRSSNDSPTTTRMSSSTNTSGSVGSIHSKDGHAPHSAPSTGNIG